MATQIERKSWGFALPKAFTLAELIVVITVLAILATVGFLALSWYSQDAKESATKANVRSVYSAISSEAAVTGNSPRFYVIHNSWAALSWAFAYVDGSQNFLTGGDWNQQNTNYSAGNPDYAKLKLNPEKFRTASARSTIRTLEAFAAYGPGNFDKNYLAVGAMASVSSTANGKMRANSYFQVAGTVPGNQTTVVMGNYPGTSSVSGSSVGLIYDPTSASLTGAMTDGGKSAVAATKKNIVADSPSGRKWSDGTYAASCAAYRTPAWDYEYSWLTGDAVYTVDPDGAGGGAPFSAYCDMTTDGGGWMLSYSTNLVQGAHRKPVTSEALPTSLTSNSNAVSKLGVVGNPSKIMYSCLDTSDVRYDFSISDPAFINAYWNVVENPVSSAGQTSGNLGCWGPYSCYVLNYSSVTDVKNSATYSPTTGRAWLFLYYSYNASTQANQFYLETYDSANNPKGFWGITAWSIWMARTCWTASSVDNGKRWMIYVK